MQNVELYSLAVDCLRQPLEEALKPEGILADDLPILGDGVEWTNTTKALREGLDKAVKILELLDQNAKTDPKPEKICA